MTYPKTLSERHWQILSPILEQIEHAKPSETFIFSYQTPAYAMQVRQTFYAWRFLYSRQSLYKLAMLSPTRISITYFGTEKPLVEAPSLSNIEEFFLTCLIDCESEEEVLKRIQASDLSSEDKIKAHAEWREKTC